MILDKLVNAGRYYKLYPGLKSALDFLRRKDLADLPDAKYEIKGKRIFATIFEGHGRGRRTSRLESHKKYIDIHYCISGFDEIGWNPVQECVNREGGYNKKKDYQLYSDIPKLWVPHGPGTFVIFFPEDAHAPITATKNLHKVVVKVRIR